MGRQANSKARDPEDVPPRLPPARTRDRRSMQLAMLAEDLLEERLRTGDASPTEVAAALRLGSAIELANIERIKHHTEYLKAQKAKAEADTVTATLMAEAMEAMREYRPKGERDADSH